MSSTDSDMKYTSPPPSYVEVMSGTLAGVHDQGGSPTAPPPQMDSDTQPLHYSQPTTFSPQQLRPFIPMPDPRFFCPPGAEPLLGSGEILVYPSHGRVYKIKDAQKDVVLTAKVQSEDECCDCCGPTAGQLGFTIRTLEKQQIAYMRRINISSFLSVKRHMHIRVTPDVPVGNIEMESLSKFLITNPSEDLLFTVTRKTSFLSVQYKIFSANGMEIGTIDHNRGIKHRLLIPANLEIRCKILLLFLTISLQKDADTRRRN